MERDETYMRQNELWRKSWTMPTTKDFWKCNVWQSLFPHLLWAYSNLLHKSYAQRHMITCWISKDIRPQKVCPYHTLQNFDSRLIRPWNRSRTFWWTLADVLVGDLVIFAKVERPHINVFRLLSSTDSNMLGTSAITTYASNARSFIWSPLLWSPMWI